MTETKYEPPIGIKVAYRPSAHGRTTVATPAYDRHNAGYMQAAGEDHDHHERHRPNRLDG